MKFWEELSNKQVGELAKVASREQIEKNTPMIIESWKRFSNTGKCPGTVRPESCQMCAFDGICFDFQEADKIRLLNEEADTAKLEILDMKTKRLKIWYDYD